MVLVFGFCLLEWFIFCVMLLQNQSATQFICFLLWIQLSFWSYQGFWSWNLCSKSAVFPIWFLGITGFNSRLCLETDERHRKCFLGQDVLQPLLVKIIWYVLKWDFAVIFWHWTMFFWLVSSLAIFRLWLESNIIVVPEKCSRRGWFGFVMLQAAVLSLGISRRAWLTWIKYRVIKRECEAAIRNWNLICLF